MTNLFRFIKARLPAVRWLVALLVALASLPLVRPAGAAVETPLAGLSNASLPEMSFAAVQVTANVLNVRAAPSTAAAIVGRLQAGDSVAPLGQSTDGRWWQIHHNGRTAYIWSAHTIQALAQPIPAGGSVAPGPAALGTPGLNGHPTLADLWAGKARFVLEVADTGLPLGESDTLLMENGELWSYVHASQQSAGAVDRCGAAVAFPGCTVIYRSGDRGRSFSAPDPLTCQFTCQSCPCNDLVDHVSQQQYPRVAVADGTWHLVYEWRGNVMLRRSLDGLAWSAPEQVRHTGIWYLWYRGCTAEERIGRHPYVPYNYECLAGGPPGIWIEDGVVYVFFAQGQNPGSMGCAYGISGEPASAYQRCAANPLFTGAASYGPLRVADASANRHFDFRTISSAEVVRVGDQLYMLYEGVRGPGPGDAGDTQFNLGLARTKAGQVDGPWETYPGNPLLVDLPGNVGLGHADLLVLDGKTLLFTSLDGVRRARLGLVWNTPK
jgi:hypothetical protein